MTLRQRLIASAMGFVLLVVSGACRRERPQNVVYTTVWLQIDGNGNCKQQDTSGKDLPMVQLQDGEGIIWQTNPPGQSFALAFQDAGFINTGTPFQYTPNTWTFNYDNNQHNSGPSVLTILEEGASIFSSSVLDFHYKTMTINGTPCNNTKDIQSFGVHVSK